MKFDYQKSDPSILHAELTALLGIPSQNEWHLTNGEVVLPETLTPALRDQALAAIEAHQAPAAILERAKEQARAKLFQWVEAKGQEPLKHTSQAEALSWPSKGAEFDAWSLDPNAPCPILRLEAQHRGMTLANYMNQKIGPKVTQHRAFVAALTATQAILEEEVDALAELSALNSWQETLFSRFESLFASLLTV